MEFIKKENIKESFKLIGAFQNIEIYDSNHAVEEFKRWFPHLSFDTYLNSINKGLIKIKNKYSNELQNYMIISHKYKMRIPLDLRLDKFERTYDKIIAVIPTTLNPNETKNLKKEIEVLVESKANHYQRFEECKNFNTYYDNNKVFTDFEEIEID